MVPPLTRYLSGYCYRLRPAPFSLCWRPLLGSRAAAVDLMVNLIRRTHSRVSRPDSAPGGRAMLVGCIAGGMRARYKAPKGAGEMGRAARICRGSALLLHSAGMVIEKPPPAGDGAVPLHPAGVKPPGADGGELPGRRRRLATAVPAPAGDGAVPPHPAGVVTTGADGGELPGRRRRLAITPPLTSRPAGSSSTASTVGYTLPFFRGHPRRVAGEEGGCFRVVSQGAGRS